jgi:F420H(2)-dependent quinone reductase
MGTEATKPPKLPPTWFIHTFWRVHRALCKLSGGRFLWTPASKRGWGALRLTTVGRKSGRKRRVILGYLDDGPNLTVLAMNGWGEGHPAWWLNLRTHPEATVRLARQPERRVRAVEATGEERERLWQRWLDVEPEMAVYASRRSTDTPVLIFEPLDEPA